jgi:glutamate/tyrosine decarboxylase-like PLP-dependent enzyme
MAMREGIGSDRAAKEARSASAETEEAMAAAFRHARDYIASLDDGRVASAVDLAPLRAALYKPLSDGGLPTAQVIDELAGDAAPGLIRSSGGRFFGWVIGGTQPAALAADWLTATWDQNAALHACSPAAAIAEEVVGEWLKDLLGLPSRSSFALVTGCQMAHVTCLAAARTALLRRRGWDVVEQGLAGTPGIRILVSEQRHASIDRAASLLGIGRANVAPLRTDALGRIDPAALRDGLASASPMATIVALQAGDIVTGAYDRFEELIPIAREAGAWVHVDGAFGLWARASAAYRQLARGCEQADSWATDGHKILNTPFDCGYAFTAHPEDHKAALSLRASYLTHAEEARDQIEWNPDWSRRGRGFPTYAVLRALGRDGVAELFERLCAQARRLAEGLGTLAGAELIGRPIVNQALVRFRDPRAGATEEDHDRRTDEVIAAINRSGEAFFTGATWRGRRVMRISVCSWRTNEADVERTIEAVRGVLAASLSESEESGR